MAQNILLVKLSSLGDVVHSFAALTDMAAQGDVRITWAVEEAFAPLAAMHPAVSRVVAVPMRRLRKTHRLWWRHADWQVALAALRAEEYDVVIDAQGLIKSAVLSRLVKAKRIAGYDWASAREAWASLCYTQKITVPRHLHAVERTRRLCAAALGYALPAAEDFALPQWQGQGAKRVVFLHGTTWVSKLLPESTWQALIALAEAAGYEVQLLWGNEEERQRAERLAQLSQAQLLPKLPLPQVAELLRSSAGVLTVDTGLGHLAAAQAVPVLGIFAPTNANLSGMRGARAVNMTLTSPCMKKDCRQHGGKLSNDCMARGEAAAIWSQFEAVLGRTI